MTLAVETGAGICPPPIRGMAAARPSSLCQLAGSWNGKAISEYGMIAETKIDGWRALYFPDHTGKRCLWSRNGYELHGVGHVLHKLALMERVAGQAMFFDGEFQVGGSLAATKAYCERDWKAGVEAGTFHAFDCLPLADWRRNDSQATLVERKRLLSDLYQASEADPLSWEWRPGTRGREPDGPAVEIMGDTWCFDAGDVRSEAQRVWSAGGEGLMLKDAESVYRRQRSSAWLKVKK